jgi:hypothetical protein
MSEFVPLSERLYVELDDMQRNIEVVRVEPTPDEIRNGWDADSLSRYLADREAGAQVSIDPRSVHRSAARRPERQVSYSPLRWRR